MKNNRPTSRNKLLQSGRFLGCLLLLLLSVVGWSQSPSFKQYSEKEGLPTSVIYQVRQGSDGRMWFATDNGISSFDGSRFRNYGRAQGLLDTDVFCISESYNGVMWFTTHSGRLFYVDNDSVRPSPFNDTLHRMTDGTSLGNIVSFTVIDDTTWLGFDLSRNNFLKIYGHQEAEVIESGALESVTNLYMLRLSDGSDIFGRQRVAWDSMGLVRKDGAENRWKLSFKADGKRRTFRIGARELDNGDVVFVDGDQIFVVAKGGSNVRKLELSTNFSTASVFQDQQGMLWVGTVRDGVYKIDPGKDYQVVGHYLQGISVTSIEEDREHGLWFSTMESGVFYTALPEVQLFDLKGLALNGKITSLLRQDDVLYATTYSGLVLKLTAREQANWSIATNSAAPVGEIMDMTGSEDGSKFFIASKSGIYRMKSGRLNHISQFHTKRFCLAHGKIFMSAAKCRVLNLDGSFSHHLMPMAGNVREMESDEDDNIWLGYLNSLRILHRSDTDTNQRLTQLLEARIAHISIAGDSVFAATASKGVAVIHRKTREIHFINAENGLPSLHCQAVLRSSNGNLWVATAMGLSQFIHVNGEYQLKKNYTSMDGFDASAISDMEEFKGKVWLASEKGLWSIPSNSESYNHVIPKIAINEVGLVRGQLFEESDLSAIAHKDNNLRFSFSGTAYRNAMELKYRFRLLGLDTHFYQTQETELLYTALPPGDYAFEVQAANNEGLWSQDAARVSFSIPEPYWKALWFLALLFFSGIGLIALGMWYRNRLMQEKREMKLALIESEQKALSSQIKPHFLYNTLNSAQFFITNNDMEKAADHLANFSILMRKVLQNTSNSFVYIKEELSILRLYLELEHERFDRQFTYDIKVAPEVELSTCLIPSMVVQPHVENAIWHGLMKAKKQNGHLQIALVREGKQLRWTIEDNGVGRDFSNTNSSEGADSAHQSSGIRLTKERLQILSEKTKLFYHMEIVDLMDAEGHPAGTKVSIIMPFDEAN